MRRCFAFASVMTSLLVPSTAGAQWAVTAFSGTSWTQPSNVRIERPAENQSLEFEGVHFDARPFEDAPYYGLRVTRFLSDRRRLGVEVELLHNKVYARTGDTVHVRGAFAGVPLDASVPMNTYVQRYNHTHGLNFLMANVVWRRPLGGASGRFALMTRGGVGAVYPGRDVVMGDLNVQGYEISGVGIQAAVGLTARLSHLFSAMVEYKFTHTRPEIDLTNGGRGRMTAASQHIVAGIAIGR
jgi:hypothetical protein